MPFFYVVAMGVLLGGFVDTGGAELEGASSYLSFVAPGLVAAHAMAIATGEVTWPVMGMVKWSRTYFGMTATPLEVGDIVTAHLAFVLLRVATSCGAFLLVLAAFGLFASALGVVAALVAVVMVGMAFAGVFFAWTATMRSEQGLAVIYRLVMLPMFLFSGAFFPISNLPAPLEVLARLTPLWQGVDLTRMLVLDQVDPARALVHVAYLLVLAAVGWWLAVWRLGKRLEV
jgi:lipooligosaccharide transport system permease protein